MKTTLLYIGLMLGAMLVGAQEDWPDLSSPARAVGGGERDAAVIVGVEKYFAVPGVPGAEANAKAWYDYLTRTRGASAGAVKLLLNNDAAREDMLGAAQKAAAKAGPEGTLWFVFIGHGAPSADGKDGLLVGVDAQQKAESLQTHSLKRGELMKALSASRAGRIVVVLDACFSGRGPDGTTIAPGLQPVLPVTSSLSLDPRAVVLTAAKGDQFAGPLPGSARPAFSYLVLGGLRGWAGKAKVTAGDLWRYAGDALEATLRGRNQTPDLLGAEDEVVGAAAGERGPDLAALAKATAGGGGFQVTNLPAVPVAEAPKALSSAAAAGLDFRDLDVEGLKKYNEAIKLDKSQAAPEEKAEAWRRLAKEVPKFSDKAGRRASEWDHFAEARKAAEEAKRKRVEARDLDWAKLSQLLALDDAVVPAADKTRWAGQFVAAYMKSPGVEPAMAKELAENLRPGATQNALRKLARQADSPPATKVSPGKSGIEWVRIPGGTFRMGASDLGASQPVHEVRVKAFQMAKTLVTNKQYHACVAAGACTPPDDCGNGSVLDSAERRSLFKGDDQPVVCVSWDQARKFSQWVGGRLPSEAEWEYAARSGGKDRKYPWGNEEATCDRAVIDPLNILRRKVNGCGRESTWPVCSKPQGNTEQGLCDMAGNVSEWVEDAHHGDYDGAPADGSAWEGQESDLRVKRGGSWAQEADIARSAFRARATPGDADNSTGFRPAR